MSDPEWSGFKWLLPEDHILMGLQAEMYHYCPLCGVRLVTGDGHEVEALAGDTQWPRTRVRCPNTKIEAARVTEISEGEGAASA